MRSIASSASLFDAVDALAEAGHVRLAVKLGDLAVVGLVGDQQPDRVRADVDDRDGGHGRLTGLGIGSPFSAASRLSTDSCVICSRASCVAEPMCGTTIRFGRSEQRVVGGQRLGVGDVERGARRSVPSLQRRGERALVDDRAARGVDEDRGRLHQPQRFGVDQVAGLLGQRAVDRDEVRALQQLEDVGASVLRLLLRRRPSSSSAGRPANSTSISKPVARLATASPIRPAPMIPSVLPFTSGRAGRPGPTCPRCRR